MPIIEKIPEEKFYCLLLHDTITNKEKSIIQSLHKSQKEYRILTKRKYALFWSIYSKYFELPEFRYRQYDNYIIAKNAKIVRNVIFRSKK